MKRTKKMVLGLVMSCIILLGTGNTQVFAASRVDGTIDGAAVSGYVTTTDSSATAVTTFTRSGGSRTVSVDVYYWWGSSYYATSASNSSSLSGGVAATATKKLGGAQVVAGKGYHRVTYNEYRWSPSPTVVGTIPSSVSWK